ncbi:uncharacterized protein [Musca autumnalis]|uniref:uncharacterized protein n=1 Tax=Musca autumnalis TaxID=221902 RepID=UPI003CFAB790
MESTVVPLENVYLCDQHIKVKEKAKGRQSIYTVVPTPPKKKPETCAVKKVPLAKKVLVTNFHSNAVKTNFNNKTPQPKASGTKTVIGSGGGGIKTKPTTSSGSTSKPSTANKPSSNLVKNGVNSATATTTKPTTSTNAALKPRQLKMPPPSTIPAKKPIASSSTAAGNAARKNIPTIKVTQVGAKSKFTTSRRTLESARQQHKKSPQQPQKNARLAQAMKAKKPVKQPATSNANKLLLLMVNQATEIVSDMIVQTPRDFSNSNHFDEFVTSTKLKNSNQTLEEVDGISPIEMISKRSSGHSAAKRNLLKDATGNNKADTNNQAAGGEDEEVKPLSSHGNPSRFNFIRYSEVNVSINEEMEENNKENNVDDNQEVNKPDEKPTSSPEDGTQEKPPSSPIQQSPNNTIKPEPPQVETQDKTPTKLLDTDKPVNYLSPFVSVSRGKVSLKRERRSSVYMTTSTAVLVSLTSFGIFSFSDNKRFLGVGLTDILRES